ncbi:MAG: carboxymuconolactone decarboxylase family protein [Dermatophilaceae bacterium]|nr:carboxymuconolactone decarboxylase family protein [Dermatophilaceae bacterium]NUO92020.1 carboxymuconolactone decarboxylase family protein [Dermatophilaceae bacterium]NUR17146.1 carboxymuconolactone decarboxylase family protein [Dermatophilaceae bacterium]
MPRIPIHTIDSAPEESRGTLAAISKRMGKTLNIHAGMAHSPVVLATYAAMSGAVREHGAFDARTREAIALAVGNENDCRYCQSAHTISAKAAGLSEEQTVAIRAGRVDFDEKLAAIVEVARQVARNTGTVSDEAWAAASAAGWSEQDIAETFAHVAVNLYTNYFNHFAGTELDLPEAPAVSA